MNDKQILTIQGLLIEHEVDEYFSTVPLEFFEDERINNVVQEISNSITQVVFSSVGLLNGYERVTSYSSIKEIVELLVKLQVIECMIENDCTFDV